MIDIQERRSWANYAERNGYKGHAKEMRELLDELERCYDELAEIKKIREEAHATGVYR